MRQFARIGGRDQRESSFWRLPPASPLQCREESLFQRSADQQAIPTGLFSFSFRQFHGGSLLPGERNGLAGGKGEEERERFPIWDLAIFRSGHKRQGKFFYYFSARIASPGGRGRGERRRSLEMHPPQLLVGMMQCRDDVVPHTYNRSRARTSSRGIQSKFDPPENPAAFA